MSSSNVSIGSASTAPGINSSTTTAAPGSTGTTAAAAAAVPGSTSDLIAKILQFQYNPVSIQQSIMQTLTDVTDGTISVVDPTNPFVFALESAACCTAAFMSENASATRKQYPIAAQTPQDLYYHMSDQDYIGRFASPASTTFSFMFNLAEIEAVAVPDVAGGFSMIEIPRNTTITVADTTFSLQYPIQIRIMAHGGLQIVYDNSEVSPLQTLSTNEITYEQRTGVGTGVFVKFDVEMFQFDIISNVGTLDAATDYTANVPLNDQFYYCRVFSMDPSTGLWVEISTTHSQEVYDIGTPTAALELLTDASGNTSLQVTIPQIYTSTSLLNQQIRYDVYETKGPINMVLSDYNFDQFGFTWLAIDANDQTPYVAPLSTLDMTFAFSDTTCVGGSNAKDFETLRTQVIMNAIGAVNTPITNIQVTNALTDLGFSVIGDVDNITNRIFVAQAGMPQPPNDTTGAQTTDGPALITAANSTVETLLLSISAITQLSTVVNNGSSVTITPDTLYQNVNGQINLLSDQQVTQLKNLPATQRATAVTNGNYMYTPFHYVLDMSSNEFNVRPYYLDNPNIPIKVFVATNDTTMLQVNTGLYAISRTTTGYQITLTTQSGSTWQQLPDNEVNVQLSFVPYGETDRAYINGVMTGKTSGGERIYTFDLSTTYNVDSNDNIELTKFFMFTTAARTVFSPLEQTFDVIYSTTSPMPSTWTQSSVDQVLGNFLLPSGSIGVTQEQLEVEMGSALPTLWARSRTVVGTQQYQSYQANVLYLYQEDVYQTDSNGSAITVTNGAVVMTKIHSKGDPVLDAQGNPTYQFLAGATILDTNNQPIPLAPAQLQYQVDIMMIDGCYYFATDTVATNYRTSLVETVIGWLTDELEEIQQELIEETQVFFKPTTTMGQIEITTGNNATQTILAQQAFVVTCSVTEDVLNNTALTNKLTTATVQTLNDQVSQSTVSLDAMLSALRAVYGNSVIGTSLTGLGGSSNLTTFSIVNAGTQCSLARQLYVQPDQSLSVQENVTVIFVPLTSTLPSSS